MRNRVAVMGVGVLLFLSCSGRELPTSPKAPASAQSVIGGSESLPVSPPSIQAVMPSFGLPAGGEMVRISGNNFGAPVRVLFAFGGKQAETFVVSMNTTSSPNSIDVITPSVPMGNTQRMPVDVEVVSRAGTTLETKTTAQNAFFYQVARPTPSILTVTPSYVSMAGGTRVQIFGDGFEVPVQVLVEQQGELREARVINVSFSQIGIDAPPARQPGFADVIVRNIISGLEARLPNALRYLTPMQVTSITPPLGPATGGTTVRISGSGFRAPVLVTIGGIPVTVLSITGTEIVGRTTAAGCNDDGPVTVIDIASGETATGAMFEYRCPRRRAA